MSESNYYNMTKFMSSPCFGGLPNRHPINSTYKIYHLFIQQTFMEIL